MSSSLSQSKSVSEVAVQDQSNSSRSSYRKGMAWKTWNAIVPKLFTWRANTNACRPRPPLHGYNRVMSVTQSVGQSVRLYPSQLPGLIRCCWGCLPSTTCKIMDHIPEKESGKNSMPCSRSAKGK